MSRPDYVKCIKDEHMDNAGKTWCGLRLEGFVFLDIDHAATNGRNKGRLVACSQCVRAVTRALNEGGYEEAST